MASGAWPPMANTGGQHDGYPTGLFQRDRGGAGPERTSRRPLEDAEGEVEAANILQAWDRAREAQNKRGVYTDSGVGPPEQSKAGAGATGAPLPWWLVKPAFQF